MLASDHSIGRNSTAEFVIVLLASTFLMGSSFIAGKILLHNGFPALRDGFAVPSHEFLFLTPLFTVVLSFFILDASLSWQQAIGGSFIGSALCLVNRNAPARNRREERAAASAEGRP